MSRWSQVGCARAVRIFDVLDLKQLRTVPVLSVWHGLAWISMHGSVFNHTLDRY